MLTKKQKTLLDFLRSCESDEVSPSFEEMKDALGLSSKSGVHRLVTALEERGFIERMPGLARAIRVIPNGPVRIPPITPGQLVGIVSRDLILEMNRRGYVVRPA